VRPLTNRRKAILDQKWQLNPLNEEYEIEGAGP
jgi:hypothetical protein